MPLAEPFGSRLTRFQKLLVLRCLRPDRVLAGVQDFVAVQLGAGFIEPPPFDLAACFKESTAATPLVFVLSPGECNRDLTLKGPSSWQKALSLHLNTGRARLSL